MSNRFHNKFHRHNHHTRPTERYGQYPDSAYDPIASPDSPFQGEFHVDGDVTSLSSISAIGDVFATNANFSGNVNIEGDLTVMGETTQLDTNVYVTSALDISNVGTGPALKVTQSGNEPIAHFVDSNGDDIIFADNGYMGLGTYTPSEKLTVIGNSFLSGSSYITGDLLVNRGNLFVDSANNKVGINNNNPTTTFDVSGTARIIATNPAEQALTIIKPDSSYVASNLAINTYYNGSSQGSGGLLLRGAGGTYESPTPTLSGRIGYVIGAGTNDGINWKNSSAINLGLESNATINNHNSYITFETLSGGYAEVRSERVRINSAGNVGIGTSTPNAKLTINGDVSASGTVAIGTLQPGTTDRIIVHDNGLLKDRNVNSSIWDTQAEFLSSQSLAVGYIPQYSGPNTLINSPIRYDGNDTLIDSDVTVTGNLTSLGFSYFANTLFNTTSSLSVVNNGPGPALYVYQSAGAYDVASFYDGDGVEVLHVGNSNPNGLGKIGINSSAPYKELTVIGSISATEVIYASGGNSNNWNSVYSNVQSNSAIWSSVYSNTQSNSANSTSVYSTVQTNSASWNSVYSITRSTSADWNSVYSTVQLNSATTWNYQGTDLKALSANWQNTYTNFSTQSANNISVYSNVQTNSANGVSVYSTVQSSSANWNYTFTNSQGNSATSLSVYSTVQSNSANWNSVYSTVATTSASWSNAFATASTQTFNTPLTASGTFLVINIGGKQQAIRLWDVS